MSIEMGVRMSQGMGVFKHHFAVATVPLGSVVSHGRCLRRLARC